MAFTFFLYTKSRILERITLALLTFSGAALIYRFHEIHSNTYVTEKDWQSLEFSLICRFEFDCFWNA